MVLHVAGLMIWDDYNITNNNSYKQWNTTLEIYMGYLQKYRSLFQHVVCLLS